MGCTRLPVWKLSGTVTVKFAAYGVGPHRCVIAVQKYRAKASCPRL